MLYSKASEHKQVKVIHDLQRRVMEIPSLMRVMNNYYYKKTAIQKQLKPLILNRFKESIKIITDNHDWLHTIPSALGTLSDDFTNKSDSFKFPDGIILFEAWMNLGYEAMFPRIALHYKFPGFLKGEKTRNLFHFIFSTSRGFGFPIYFKPSFYGNKLKQLKVLEPIFRWVHNICHKANQALFIVSERFNIKRHHPGEFESVIISEYKENQFKGIDTLLHGYFTRDPKLLGTFNNLETVLENISFSYSIGDHAMSIENTTAIPHLSVRLLTNDLIIEKYNVDFYTYILNLMEFKKILVKEIVKCKRKKKEIMKNFSIFGKILLRLNRSKARSNQIFYEYLKKEKSAQLMEDLLNMIWTTPLYTHTIHNSIKQESKYNEFLKKFEKNAVDSIFSLYIAYFERKNNIIFEENLVLEKIDQLRDNMARMWLYFKERQFNAALRKVKIFSSLSIMDKNYVDIVNKNIDELIPIFSIYELFHRPLAESVYPEADPQIRRFGAYLASFLTSRYNPIGVNLMILFNKLAFNNWSQFILKNQLNQKDLFKEILNLPLWKHIPNHIKDLILNLNY